MKRKQEPWKIPAMGPAPNPKLKEIDPEGYGEARAGVLQCRLDTTNDESKSRDLIDFLDSLLEDRDWELFPLDKNKKPLARSFSDWVLMISGYDLDEIYKLILTFLPDDALRELRSRIAEVDGDLVRPGAPEGNQNASKGEEETNTDMISNCSEGRNYSHGTSSSYLLRRIARKANGNPKKNIPPDPFFKEILTRYEKKGFSSVRAAAIAAGIIHVPTPYEAAQKAYSKLTEAEREQFRRWLDHLA